MPRYYLQGTGQTCYDRAGVTFPERFAVDWQAVVGPRPAERPEIAWRRRRDNQPEEITFVVATQREAEAVVDRLDALCREAGLRDTGFIASPWPGEELVVFAVAAEGDPETAPGATVERNGDGYPEGFAVTDKIGATTEGARTLTEAILRAWELTTGERPDAGELLTVARAELIGAAGPEIAAVTERIATALAEVTALRDQAPAGSHRRTELVSAMVALRGALENLRAAEEKGPRPPWRPGRDQAPAGEGLRIALEIDGNPEAWGEEADEEIAGEAALVLGELLGARVQEAWPRAELTSRTVRVTSGASHRIADVSRADGAAGTFAEQEAREEIAALIAGWSEELREDALERALGGDQDGPEVVGGRLTLEIIGGGALIVAGDDRGLLEALGRDLCRRMAGARVLVAAEVPEDAEGEGQVAGLVVIADDPATLRAAAEAMAALIVEAEMN